jgi:hypothetical protein
MRTAAASLIVAAGIGVAHAAQADLEMTAPDGRRVLLKENGTWSYVDAKPKVAADEKSDGELLLLLERKLEGGTTCRFGMQLVNKLPYEVQSIVLYFSAYRSDGVLYTTETTGSQFSALKPGNSQRREVEFRGIGCKEIARLQVSGGDRCTMGELHRWSDQIEVKGKCLARVKVVESNLVRFDK